MAGTHARQAFGGGWTADKLGRVGQYLAAYTRVMKNQPFKTAYIDAFAGTGYTRLQESGDEPTLMMPELAESEAQGFLAGSARVALEVDPPFDRYIFIEQDPARAGELHALAAEYPEREADVAVRVGDANTRLEGLCRSVDWESRRAVLFLDPFGMQVEWKTIERIAGTRALDVWMLFPLGVAVNRLLRRNGEIPPALADRLTRIFGTEGWRDAFYQPSRQTSFLDGPEAVEKVADFRAIAEFWMDRLRGVFAKVAPNPLTLRNSCNSPLYLLCFACSNPRGADTAVRIAQHILRP